jgi:hypothetical protein
LPRGTFDHRRTLLGNYDCRRVGVGGGDRRHYRGVDDTQPVEPVHPQFVVDDRVGDARDIVVLHVLGVAVQLVHERRADAPVMLGIADNRQLPITKQRS